jgi:C-terminal processing protease CtpA/Prc
MGQQEHYKRLQDQAAASSDDAVKHVLSTARGLTEFLQNVEKLQDKDLELIVDQAIAMLEGYYVHLPFKRAMYGIDPLRRLQLLRRRVGEYTSEIAFHKEMTGIFTSLRDLHTNYVLPSHFAAMVAFLPFRVEAWYESLGGAAHYIVSSTAKGFIHPTFETGVELRYYNGVPIERAMEIASEYHAGSNSSARRARGIAGLTKRAMNVSPPPDEEWAIIGYTTLAGVEDEVKLDWSITELPEMGQPAPAANAEIAQALGLDIEGDTFRRCDRMLYGEDVIKKSRDLASHRAATKARQSVDPRPASEAEAFGLEAAAGVVSGTESIMPLVFTARPVPFGGRNLAHVSIHTFLVDDDAEFVNEFLRLISLPAMPQDGLIIDVRGNSGGLIWAGERLLQLLTPRTIEPCRAQFISTPQSLALCATVKALGQWRPSIERALTTGAVYSAAFPITPPARCNDIGQRYYGPVVLITDARCYSTTDIFAAGFRDHAIGKILGTDSNMGAGGANVWTLDQIRVAFSGPGVVSPLSQLPRDAGMRVALRRTLRVGPEAGTEMEDFGIVPNKQHALTKDDVLNDDPDLLAAAAALLATMDVFKFDLTWSRTGNTVTVALATKGVDYVDVFIDNRSRPSQDVANDAVTFDVDAAPGSMIDLRGYRGTGQLVCARRALLS